MCDALMHPGEVCVRGDTAGEGNGDGGAGSAFILRRRFGGHWGLK